MIVTTSNVLKLLSLVTAGFWLLVGVVLAIDAGTGSWMQKGGLWIALVYFTGFCGPVVWAMVGPLAFDAVREASRDLRPEPVVKIIWCLSTAPVVLAAFSLVCLLVYHRLAD